MSAVVPVPGRRVFDVVGRPTSRGVTWVWTRDDLDHATLERAYAQLAALFSEAAGPRRLLVYVGADRFVSVAGLRLLLEFGRRAGRCGGALAVVAPPRCLLRMLSCLELDEQLMVFDSVQHAASRSWTRPPTPLPGSILMTARRLLVPDTSGEKDGGGFGGSFLSPVPAD